MRNLKIINIITKIILIIILVSMGIPFQAYGQIDMTRSSIPVPYNTLFNLALKNNYSPFSDIWINVKDNASASNTTNMIFGNHQDASYGIDEALGEKESPPLPPGFGVLWVNIPGRVNQWGVGLLRYDYRGIPTNSEKKDTFKLRFQNGVAPDADFVFKWPNADYLTQRCDSMFIYNPLLGSPINMFTTDSLVIPAAGDNGIYTLTIYKYGCRLLELIRPNGGEYFYIGSTDTIKWQSFGINTVQLEYSTDAGSSWSLIAGSVPASDGIFTWDIPNAPTNKAKIRLSDSSDTNVFDESDTTFTIQNPPVMTVVPDSFVVSLNEGDSTLRTMTIGNVGLGDLQWEITASSTSIKPMESLKIQYFSKSTVSDPSLPFMNTDFLDLPSNRFQNNRQNTSGVFFADGFEDDDYNGWTSLGTGTKEVTNATAANGTMYSFHEYNSPGGHDLGVVHYLGSCQPKYVSVYIRSSSTSTADAYFVPRSSFGSFPFWIYANESGQIRVGGNSWSIDVGTYIAHVWYHAEFKNISWSDSTFDFYLDGNLIQSGLSLEGSSDIASIDLYNYEAGSEGWWDEIYIGDTNMDWWNVTPTSGTVSSVSTQDVAVKFNAKDLRGGDYYANIVINSNDPVNSPKQVPTLLHVIGAPNIVVSDDTLDFGDGFIGYHDTLMLRISNTGSDTLKISGMVIDNSDFTVAGSTMFAVSPEQYRDVGVVFSPTTTGLESGTLTISSNDSFDLTMLVHLQGNGVHPPLMTVVPDSFAVSLNEGDSTSRTMTIGNTGLGTLTWEISHIASSAVKAYSLPAATVTATFTDKQPSTKQSNIQSVAERHIGELCVVLSDLTGKRIGITSMMNYYTLIWSDLQARGAITRDVTFPLSIGLLDSLDVLAVDDAISMASPSDITAIRTWAQNGKGLLVQGDNASSMTMINALLLGTGISETSLDGFYDGSLTNILPHPITVGVDTIIELAYGSYCTVTSPAQTIVFDDSSRPHVATSILGQGRIVAVGNEVCLDDNISYEYNDTRLFSNQIFDWLAETCTYLSVVPDHGTISSGSSEDVTVDFNAEKLRGGDYHATIVIESNDPVNNPKQVPVHLHVIGAPNIVVSDDTLDFGDGFIGYHDALMLRVSNTGSDTLKISGMVIDNSNFTVAGSTIFAVSPDQYRDVGVIFSPTATGLESGSLTISSNDSSDLTMVVYLQGKGVHPPVMTVVPDSFTVSLNEGDSTTRTMTIGNTGLGDLQWSISGGSPLSYSKSKLSASPRSIPTANPTNTPSYSKIDGVRSIYNTIAGYDSGTFKEDFETGSLSPVWNTDSSHIRAITSSTAANSTVYSLTQTRLSGAGHFDGVQANFPPIQSKRVSFWIRVGSGMTDSTEAAAYFVLGDSLTQLNMGAFWFMAKGDGRFELYPVDASFMYQTNTWYHIQFENINWVTKTFDYFVNNTLIATGLLFRAQSTMNFSQLHLYSYTANIQAWWDEIYIGDANMDWWNVTLTSGTISSGSTQEVTVEFNAKDLRCGNYHANIAIESNDPVNSPKQVPTHLHVIGAPNIVVSDDTLDFGDGFIGYNDTLMLRISNTGSDTLKIGGMVIDNSHFTVAGSTIFSVSPDQYRDVGVVFSPTATGLENGTLTISSNDSSDLTMLVYLQGNGIHPPVMTVIPDSFAVSINEGDSTSRTMTIGNTGLGTLHWTVTGTSITENKLLHDYVKPQNVHAGNVFNGVEVSDPTSLQNFNIANDDLEFYNVVNQNKKWQNLQTSFSATTTISFDDTTAPCLFVNAYPLHLRYSEFGVNFQSGANPNGGAIVDSCGNWGVSGFSSPNFLGFNTSATLANGGMPILPETLYFSIPTAFVRAQFGLGRSSSPVTITVTGFNSSNSIVARDSISPTFVLQPLEISGSGITKVVISTTSFNSYYFVIDDLNYGGTPWLSVDPTSGTVAPSATQDVTVQFNAAGLDSGFYTGNMLISSNDPAHPLITLPIALHVVSGPVGVEDVLDKLPKEFVLSQNYPNPFNPLTKIRYELPVASQVRLKIYNLLGQEVMTLMDEVQPAGYVAIDWNSTNNAGASVSSGIYFYRLEATNIANPKDSFIQVKKLMLIK